MPLCFKKHQAAPHKETPVKSSSLMSALYGHFHQNHSRAESHKRCYGEQILLSTDCTSSSQDSKDVNA